MLKGNSSAQMTQNLMLAAVPSVITMMIWCSLMIRARKCANGAAQPTSKKLMALKTGYAITAVAIGRVSLHCCQRSGALRRQGFGVQKFKISKMFNSSKNVQ